MGVGYRCDSCGRFFDGAAALHVNAWGGELHKQVPGIAGLTLDLCSECEQPTRLHLTSLFHLNSELPSYGGTDDE